VERIDLAGAEQVHVDRQWQSTGGAVVRIGTVGRGWFAWHSRRGPAFAFVHERAMADLADKWLARGDWRETGPVDS
jgi:hypothetical protein